MCNKCNVKPTRSKGMCHNCYEKVRRNDSQAIAKKARIIANASSVKAKPPALNSKPPALDSNVFVLRDPCQYESLSDEDDDSISVEVSKDPDSSPKRIMSLK